jgi:hypothetical protein
LDNHVIDPFESKTANTQVYHKQVNHHGFSSDVSQTGQTEQTVLVGLSKIKILW